MNSKVITIIILLALAAFVAALFGGNMLNRGESATGGDLSEDVGSCQEVCQQSCAEFQGGEKDQCLTECTQLCEGNF